MPLIDHFKLQSCIDIDSNLRNGCIVDTNILFAAYFSDDSQHEKSLEILQSLIDARVPILTNVNIRAEFINLALRVIVPMGLCDLFRDAGVRLPEPVYKQLKSINQTVSDALKKEKVFKMQNNRIKSLRELLSNYYHEKGSVWDLFCEEYLDGKLKAEWSSLEKDLSLNFLTLRFSKDTNHLRAELLWEDVVSVMEKTAIGSADAMIINLLDKSNYSLIASLDEDIRYALDHLGMDDKFLIC